MRPDRRRRIAPPILAASNCLPRPLFLSLRWPLFLGVREPVLAKQCKLEEVGESRAMSYGTIIRLLFSCCPFSLPRSPLPGPSPARFFMQQVDKILQPQTHLVVAHGVDKP